VGFSQCACQPPPSATGWPSTVSSVETLLEPPAASTLRVTLCPASTTAGDTPRLSVSGASAAATGGHAG
jgi:hypothetical protein